MNCTHKEKIPSKYVRKYIKISYFKTPWFSEWFGGHISCSGSCQPNTIVSEEKISCQWVGGGRPMTPNWPSIFILTEVGSSSVSWRHTSMEESVVLQFSHKRWPPSLDGPRQRGILNPPQFLFTHFPDTTQTLDQVQLDYTTLELTGTIAAGAQGQGNFDLLVLGTDEDVLYNGSITSTTDIPPCTLGVYSDKKVPIDYILVDYDGGNSPETYTYWTGSVFGEYVEINYHYY